MKKLLILPLLLMISFSGSAQIIDDSSVDQAQSGYNFVEGRFVAYLADTVSPGFIEKVFQELEIPVLDMEIEPLVISIINQPSEKSLAALNNHSKIMTMHTMVDKTSELRLEQMLKERGYSEEQIKELKSKAAETNRYLIRFDYSVNEQIAKTIMGEFRDVAYRIMSTPYKTVTLKAKEGEEPALMYRVEQLDFVEATAMIGSIKN